MFKIILIVIISTIVVISVTGMLKDIVISVGMIGLISALMELIKGLYSTKAYEE